MLFKPAPLPEKEVAVTVPTTSNAVVGAVVLPIATLCDEKISSPTSLKASDTDVASYSPATSVKTSVISLVASRDFAYASQCSSFIFSTPDTPECAFACDNAPVNVAASL